MNRTLLVFSLILIFLGIFFASYFILVLGALLLFPALLSRARRPEAPTTPTRGEPRRISPAKPKFVPPRSTSVETTTAPHTSPAVFLPPEQPQSTPSFSAPLFPIPLMPTLSPYTATTTQPAPQKTEERKERDELLEIGAILLALKLYSS